MLFSLLIARELKFELRSVKFCGGANYFRGVNDHVAFSIVEFVPVINQST